MKKITLLLLITLLASCKKDDIKKPTVHCGNIAWIEESNTKIGDLDVVIIEYNSVNLFGITIPKSDSSKYKIGEKLCIEKY